MYWFWIFMLYSFVGYVIEKLFAVARNADHRVRKCFLLLPLCPVYGLSLIAVLHLPTELRDTPLRLIFYGGLTATVVEYAVHLFYDKVLGVMFWDYSSTKMDLNRRVCVPFSVAWGLLVWIALRYVQPWFDALIRQISPTVTFAAVLLLVADSFYSVRLLYLRHDIDLLGIRNLVRDLQT
ncbi:MAG: putative ABC transporter permease [Eubacteriales bacterium]|nr:putative ABC transporter permease [Eubacteriales bacterium]